jgi:nucleoside phosphorylase
MTYPVRLVVALPVEAKPVVSRFHLSQIQLDHGFPIYRNKNISLIISGTGKVNAQAAVRHLYAFAQSSIKAIWVNFGIAGHPVRALGEAFLARRVVDDETADSWEVSMGLLSSFDADDLLTVGAPDFEYKAPYAIDMEAAGFFPTAKALSTPGLVQCLKIVSDNPVSPADRVNKKLVRRLIEEKLDILDTLLIKLGGDMG